MKIQRTTLAATVIPLLLASLPVAAGELPFKAPDTARAQESAQLLHQAARALGDQPTIVQGQHISNLWIFPTADTDTVFAQYEVSSNDANVVSTKHLAVLKVSGDRIVGQQELTDTRTYSASDDEHPTATPHWSASIGTGYAASTEATTPAHGVPANPHWTALIGTGAAVSSATATETRQPASLTNKSAVADAHWTSRIGTGHAADSNSQEGT